MSESSSKEAFKKYLQQKKQVIQNLSKAEQKEIQNLEENAIVKRINKRVRYSEDDDFRKRQQASARESMRKRKTEKTETYTEPKMKKVPMGNVQIEDDDVDENVPENNEVQVESKIIDPRRLY
jgi:hypothetical protein